VKKRTSKAGTSRCAAQDRRRRFVEAYVLNGGNATQAAVAAGYKPGAAAEKAGYRMSRNVRVSAELQKRAGAMAERAELKVEALASVLRAIVHARAVDVLTPKQRAQLPALTPELETAIVGFKFDNKGRIREVRLADKNAAIERALRLHAMTARIGALEGTPSEQARTVAARVARGELTLEQGTAFVNMIAAQVRIVEADDLERRLQALEQKAAAASG
jgi:polyhydroxyalkanoate synthesis regulator phasin